jgi:hypothetical protein
MAQVQRRVDLLTKNNILVPPKLEDFCEREQAIGEARGLLSVDEMVRLEIARIENEIAENERPDAAAAKSDAVDPERDDSGV